MDDRFIRKHNVVGERLLEGTLRGTDGLRAGLECSRGFVWCPGMFVQAKMGPGVVGFDTGERPSDPWSVQELRDGVKERRTRKPGYKYALA